jgi:small ligand-binding sensory domain FIST
MRYANSKHSHKGLGVEPRGGSVLIEDEEARNQFHIRDKDQLQEVINLLRHASIINGWGAVK